eukprot:s753_g2.t1
MHMFPEGFAAAVSDSSQPLGPDISHVAAVEVNDHGMQPVEAYHYCASESFAVIDTGCQRSAIGRRTLENIASRLPAGLSIKFASQRFRLTGIGGETVTSCVALIPVCFGQRPGMIRAAILEDTPDAPFLLSLPILKALDTTLSLGEQSMHFQAINESGMMFYNDKGQLCLRLFEFDAISDRSSESPDRWQVQKIIGDECHVFMLHEPQCQDFGKFYVKGKQSNVNQPRDMEIDRNVVLGNCDPCQNPYVDTKDATSKDVVSNPCTVTQRDVPQFSVSAEKTCCDPQWQSVSSIAETPVSQSDPCVINHGGSSAVQVQQASVHSCGIRAEAHQHLGSFCQQAQDSGSSGYYGSSHDRVGHTVDEHVGSSTGDDDESCRYGRGRYPPGHDEQSGAGETSAGEGAAKSSEGTAVHSSIEGSSQLQEDEFGGQLLRGLRGESGHFHVPSKPRSSNCELKSKCEKPEESQDGESMLLRTQANSLHMSQTGSQLHETIPQVPEGAQLQRSMSLFPMDSRDQRRGVREDVCYLAGVTEASKHHHEVKAALRRRIFLIRARCGLSEPCASSTSTQPTKLSTTQSSRLRSSVEQEGIQCIPKDANLSQVRTPGNHPLQGRHGLCEVGGCGDAQEVRSTSCSESVSLKSGQRKHVLGEIQKRIDQLEQQEQKPDVDDMTQNLECDNSMLESSILKELMHLRLVGEVFSPERFVSHAPKHGLQAGQAFDLRLGHQLLCPKQRKKCLQHLIENPYELVIVTPPCTMFSLLQYLGLGKTKESCMNDPEFQRKYHEACILLTFAAVVCTIQARRGQSFLFEQPWNALSWKEPSIRKLLNEPGTILVRTDQCMFGQKDLDQKFIRKRTGFLTNHVGIAAALRRTCRGQHVHQPCVGSSQGHARADRASRYPNALVDAVLRAFAKSDPNATALPQVPVSSIQWSQQCPDGSTRDVKHTHVFYGCCTETDVKFRHDSNEDCSEFVVDPTQQVVQFLDETPMTQFAVQDIANVEANASHQPLTEDESQAVERLSPDQRRSLRNELVRAHRGMGHPNHDRFLRILRLGGASVATLGLAKTFECSQCKEDTRPKPWRRAAPPRELSFNEVVGIDTVTIKHHDTSIKCLNIVCWGTRYQMIIPLSGLTASHVRAAYRTWIKLFGPPRVIKPDMGTEFLGAFMYRTSTDGSEVDLRSLESPTQNSITEREGGSFKTMFNKASLDYGPTSDSSEIFELIDTVVMCKNRLSHRGGYSAIHRVFGYTPAMPGDVLMSRDEEDNLMHHSMIELGDVTLQKQARMRECAGRAFFSSECASAIRRAVASGPRKVQSFEVGQLVYFWSMGQFNKVAVHHSASRRPNHQFWNGPCRVVATQYPSSIYVSYQGRLVKAAPEQLRLASSDEDAACSAILKNLCEIRAELRSNKISGLSDIRHEPYPPEPEDHPTGRKRAYAKQPPFDPQKQPKLSLDDIDRIMQDDDDDIVPSPSTPREPSDVDTESFDSDQELLLERIENYPTEVIDTTQPFVLFDTEGDYSIETTVEAYAEGTGAPSHHVNKRASKELRLKDLDSHDFELFKQAIQKEWRTNIDNGAIAVIEPQEAQKIRQHQSHRIMQSRLLHVAKPIDDVTQVEPSSVLNCSPDGAPCKAKSRWVARGDKDPDLFNVCASSPVIHRDTFMMGLQAISAMRWRMHFADFSQAFMQGDSLKRDAPLYCEPPERELLGLPPNCLIEIRKTVYGLVDAPYRWNRHLDQAFQSLGYRPSLLDPCCYLLHSKDAQNQSTFDGIIMVATDDLVSGGNERHQALMQQLKSRYKFGKWEYDSGRFCGKDIQQRKDSSIHVSQQYYVEQKCTDRIVIPKGTNNDTPCTSEQVKQLREKVGALSWLSKETRVDLAGSVSLLMQAFPCPVIGDLKTCNKILKEAVLFKDLGVTIRPVNPKDLCIVVSSDAAWANARDEEGEHKSQAGYIVLSTDRKMLQGKETEFSMLSWKSHTLKRRTISTLSAETQGIVESAAVACWFRYLIAEMFYSDLVKQGQIDWETMLEPLEFGVITDAKSVYDALTASNHSSSSTDKRTCIDLAIIREYLRRHNGCIRWIDGTVQLADSLTKFMTADFLRSVIARGSYQLQAEFDTLNLRHKAKEEKRLRKSKINQQ